MRYSCVMNTMMDIAEKAGVSQTTVSRVINGDAKVAERTAAAVTRAMRELDYAVRPRRKRARSGPNGHLPGHGVLALVMLDESMAAHPAMALAKLRGVERATNQAGLSLVVTCLHDDDELPPPLLRPDLRGVLLWGYTIHPQLARQIENLPHLWLTSHTAADDNIVLIGNEQAGRLAADYLLDHGVQHPAVIYPCSLDPRYKLRADGFHYACHIRNREAVVINSEVTDDTVFSRLPSDRQESVMNGMIEQIIARKPRPDGMFMLDDALTALAYPLLREHGIEPERDIRIVSCDNESTYLNALRPRPATIDLAPETTGRLAVEHLMRLIAGDRADDEVSFLIRPRLVAPAAAEAGAVRVAARSRTLSTAPPR